MKVFKLIFLFWILFVSNIYAEQDSLNSVLSRKKVGVVLSGGGAKGVAHISAIKAIEQAGIPIDIVVGTSMGALVGGLYAIGYSTDQMDSIVRNIEWMNIISDKLEQNDMSYDRKKRSQKYVLSIPFSKGENSSILGNAIFKGQNVTNLIAELTYGYHDSLDFNSLKKQYACVAFNVTDGTEHVFHSGVLYKAMRASMAVPGVFDPVKIKDKLLVDGGMKNNFPVDVAKEMGADIIIGVDVGDNLENIDKLNNVASILNQIITIACKSKHEENIALTDVYIKVNVDNYSSTSFNKEAIDSLLVRGEIASNEHKDELLALRDKIGLIDNNIESNYEEFYRPISDDDTIKINKVVIRGIKDEYEKKQIEDFYNFNKEDTMLITIRQIKKTISKINGTLDYTSVNYIIRKKNNENILTFFIDEKKENNLNLGVRYDNEEKLAALVNLNYNLNLKLPTAISLEGRVGDQSYVKGSLILKSYKGYGLDFSYKYQYNDINIYHNSDRLYNETYRYHCGEISLFSIFFQKTKVKFGARYENYEFNSFLINPNAIEWDMPKDGQYISYFVHTYFDSYNKRCFPTKGSYLTSELSLHTDNFLTYDFERPIIDVMFFWKKIVSVSSRFSIMPNLCGRMILSNSDVPYVYYNTIGGFTQGKYNQYQLPFIGISHSEIEDNGVLLARLDFRERILKNHYVTLSGNACLGSNKIKELDKSSSIWGAGLSYGYDSFLGPLEFSLYKSSVSKHLGYYINVGYYF